jgi:hypothetical protein
VLRAAGRTVGIALGVTAVLFFVIGGQRGIPLPLPIALAFAAVAFVLFRGRPVRTLEVGWSGTDAAVTPVADVPIRPTSAPRSGKGSVAGSLARVEARELVMSPWFAAGVGFWLLIIVVMGVVFSDDASNSWWEFAGLLTMAAHPFAGMTVVAAHRNRSRSGRDDCDELFNACPADADARTLGHLLTAWVAAVACGAAVSLFVVLIATRSTVYGPADHELVAALLGCAVIGAGAVTLGVALGRWARWAIVPFGVVVAIAALGSRIVRIGNPGWATDRMLATFVPTAGIDTIFYTRPVWARLAWLTALVFVVASAAMVGRRRSVTFAVLASSVIAALGAGALVIRPATTRQATRIVARIETPLRGATCAAAGDEVRVCAYPMYRTIVDRTVDALRPVADAVPQGVLSDVVLVPMYAQMPNHLQAEVRARLTSTAPRVPEHALRLRFQAHRDAYDAARLRLAAYAVGLPPEPGPDEFGTIVAGQARGVVVLWLAWHALDADRIRDRLDVSDDSPGEKLDDTDLGAVWPGTCGAGDHAALQWAPKDLDAASMLFALPDTRVRDVITREWSRFTSPTATTDDLLAAAGLHPIGPPERIVPRVFGC